MILRRYRPRLPATLRPLAAAQPANAQEDFNPVVSVTGLSLKESLLNKEGASIGMDAQTRWEKIYTEKAPDAVSWYRPHLETSLALIAQAADGCSSLVIDGGGGESTLVDDLLARGYPSVTVLDISQTAIDANWKRLGKASKRGSDQSYPAAGRYVRERGYPVRYW